MDIKIKIESIKTEFDSKIANISSTKELQEIKVYYLGKKGLVTSLMLLMKEVENKKEIGSLINELKQYIINILNSTENIIYKREMDSKLESDKIDITLPSIKIPSGIMNPIYKVINEIEELFISQGYDVVEGPEIEYDLYNFEMLNVPEGHPARDTQDSFYITNEMLLRTQTSPVQARTMEANVEKKPLRIICPGKTYRKDDDDATHSHQFTQIEGLVIGENISISDLKGTLEEFAKKMFGSDRKIRFRPSFFPFTEPSLEVDISCFKCGSTGCNLCKKTGWIEILGAGMVHPNVLKMGGYDPLKYTGFAFGMGPERIAMLKYGITDIRDFYTNDLRFLKQFGSIEEDTYEN